MSLEQEMQAALGSFIVEARELLTQMESDLLGLELQEGEALREMINSVFRAAHTIKGSSGLFGLDHIVRFTHVVESVLDRLRDDEISVSPDLINALLPCADHLSSLVTGVAEGYLDENPDDVEIGATLIAGLQPFLNGEPAAQEKPSGGADVEATSPRRVFLSLRFGIDCLRNGMDPLAFIRYLSTLGEVDSVTTLTELIPDVVGFDPETCYLAFAVTLQTEASLETVVDVFEFVRDSSTITVLGPENPPSDYAELVREAGEFQQALRDALVQMRIMDAAMLDALVQGQPVPAAGVPAPRSSTRSRASKAQVEEQPPQVDGQAKPQVEEQPPQVEGQAKPQEVPARPQDDDRRVADRRASRPPRE